MSRNFLIAAGVETSDGLMVSLDGNQLPNAPEHTLKVGVAHTWTLSDGATFTGRWDYYWQSESYAREFNSVGDHIDSWSQHNASAIYENGSWQVRAWVRNLLDDDNVTGKIPHFRHVRFLPQLLPHRAAHLRGFGAMDFGEG